MTDVFLERLFEHPLTVEHAQAMGRDGAWCFEMHRVDWISSLLAADGRSMVCWFRAVDAESVRLALRTVGADVARTWIGTVTASRVPAVPNVLVARSFPEPVTLESIRALAPVGGSCMDTHRVRFAGSFFALDQRRMLCLYQAPDAESVRIVQRAMRMPFDSVQAFARVSRGSPDDPFPVP